MNTIGKKPAKYQEKLSKHTSSSQIWACYFFWPNICDYFNCWLNRYHTFRDVHRLNERGHGYVKGYLFTATSRVWAQHFPKKHTCTFRPYVPALNQGVCDTHRWCIWPNVQFCVNIHITLLLSNSTWIWVGMCLLSLGVGHILRPVFPQKGIHFYTSATNLEQNLPYIAHVSQLSSFIIQFRKFWSETNEIMLN